MQPGRQHAARPCCSAISPDVANPRRGHVVRARHQDDLPVGPRGSMPITVPEGHAIALEDGERPTRGAS